MDETDQMEGVRPGALRAGTRVQVQDRGAEYSGKIVLPQAGDRGRHGAFDSRRDLVVQVGGRRRVFGKTDVKRLGAI